MIALPSGRTLRYAGAAALIAVLVSGAWGLVVPPFEGPDESAFYKGLMTRARGQGSRALPLYGTIMEPALRIAGGQDRPFQATYNPSFRFVGNGYGRVNVYMHGLAETALRGDVNRLYLLRLLTILLWTISILLIFSTARLFFGRDVLSLLTAVAVIALPQVSFFSSKIHPEATSTLLACIAYFALAARVTGRLGRGASLTLALIALALSPFSDRQGYFVFLLVPFGLVLTELKAKAWRPAALLCAVFLTGAAAVLLVPALRPLRDDLQTFLNPFLPGYQAGWWNDDTPQYLLFEFLPKMFFGFCGWIGQPSILLPPPVYAALAVMMGIAVTGLTLRRDGDRLTPDQRLLAWIFGIGFACMLGPILYENILISRNSWHGRWLFPSIGPIAIALISGWRSFAARASRTPHRVALVLIAIAAGLAAWWWSSASDAARALIRANHYGDQPHLLMTIGDIIIALGLAGVLVEAAAAMRTPASGLRRHAVGLTAGVCILANGAVLFGFVAPLYRPFGAEDFAEGVRAEVHDGEYGRASALYTVALKTFPTAPIVRQLAVEHPLLLLTSGDPRAVGQLSDLIARGLRFETHSEMLALARLVRVRGWGDPLVLQPILDHAREVPELAADALLVQLLVEHRSHEDQAAEHVIDAGHGVRTPLEMHGDAQMVGYIVQRLPAGVIEVVVYFRPERSWSGRWLWLHAYPQGRKDYIGFEVAPPAFGGWEAGELAWEAFRVPAGMRLSSYLGLAIGENLGEGYSLGWIGP